MIIRVYYKESHDANGSYRWWTKEMAEVGQFNHAWNVRDIPDLARREVVKVDLQEVEDE